MYLRALQDHGEPVIVRRITGDTTTDVTVQARVMGYRPEELTGDIDQGHRKVILMPDWLVAANWPLPIKKGDQIVIRNKQTTVEIVDDNTRRIAGELIAYELSVSGA